MIKNILKRGGNETERKTEKQRVDERREEILAKGRKFKYPLQFAKHRLVAITVIISVLAILVMTAVGWFLLYKKQSEGDIIYRVARVLPVPVAKVDGENVNFGDYLLIYRSSMRAVEQQSGTLGTDEEAEEVRARYKRAALDQAEEYAFSRKLARENGVSVGRDEINEAFLAHRNIGGVEKSEESFLKVVADNFGMDKREYEQMIEMALMQVRVSEKIDETANETAERVEEMLAKNGGNFDEVAKELTGVVNVEATGGLVSNKNIDGGRAERAFNLEKGEVSERFVSSNGDGYYFVKLLNKNEKQVDYISIKVPFVELRTRFEKAKAEGKIEEYIEIRVE